MPDLEDMTPGQVLAEASVADFIKSLGLSIAEAQKALDENSVNQMGEFITPREGLGGKSLLDIGLMPAFYHYQHADITCSMQISLKVEKNIGVGVNLGGSFSDTSGTNASTSNSSSSTESGSSTSTQTRSASVDISVESQGALTVGGQNFQLSGTSPRDRINALSDAVRGQQDISRVIPVQNCSPVTPTPTTDAPTANVVCTPNAVSFVGGGFDSGFIRISENPSAANSPEAYKLNASKTVNVTRSNSVAAYASKVKDAIVAEGFEAEHLSPDEMTYGILFDVDKAFIRANEEDGLLKFARFLVATGLSAKVNGYASTTGSDAHNMKLSTERAKAVRNRLVANGVDPAKLTLDSFGEQRWRDAGFPDRTENQPHRLVEVVIDGADHYVWVSGDASNSLSGVTPDKRAPGSTGNGWVYLYDAVGLSSLNGKKVTIKGQEFLLSGTSASGTPAANSAQAFALNLATAVNGNANVRVKASAAGNVTTLCNEGDKYQLILVTSSNREISLSGTSGVTVTESFTRSTSSSGTTANTGNRTVAVNASVDVNYARKFEMNVTGNSSISARLVSIPAPPQFLETIKSYLDQGNGG